MQDWFLRTSEYKNLSDNISREIYNKINAEKPDIFNISKRLERTFN